jgi:hypothetical protein
MLNDLGKCRWGKEPNSHPAEVGQGIKDENWVRETNQPPRVGHGRSLS